MLQWEIFVRLNPVWAWRCWFPGSGGPAKLKHFFQRAKRAFPCQKTPLSLGIRHFFDDTYCYITDSWMVVRYGLLPSRPDSKTWSQLIPGSACFRASSCPERPPTSKESRPVWESDLFGVHIFYFLFSVSCLFILGVIIVDIILGANTAIAIIPAVFIYPFHAIKTETAKPTIMQHRPNHCPLV